MASPETKFPFVVTRKDTGPHVKVAILDLPPRSNLLVYSEMASWNEYIEIFEEVTGLKLVYKEVSIEEADKASPWHHIGREAGEVKQFAQELGWHGGDPSMLFHEDVSRGDHFLAEQSADETSVVGEERDLVEDDESTGMVRKRGLVGLEELEKVLKSSVVRRYRGLEPLPCKCRAQEEAGGKTQALSESFVSAQ